VALAWLMMPGSSSAVAFTKLVNAVVSAKSARFHAESTVEGLPKQSANVAFLAPAKYRMEMGKTISITDFENAKMFTIMPDQKQAVVFNLKNAATDRTALDQHNHFERLRQLLREQREQPSAYERLGEKVIDGRKAVGFRLETPICTTTLWGDVKSGDPVRIETTYTGVPKSEVVMTQFEMNVDLKPELFALDVPKDYKVQSFDIDASKPKEQDFVESLKICTELSGGVFPESLDTQGLMKLMFEKISSAKLGSGVKEPDTERLMQQSLTIGRGFQFALSLPASANAHYAGKGVKKDTANRPIFWYLPEGSKRYRVVDASLTTHDADEAPQIEAAVPLFKKKPAGEKSK
jgi:outer membrane lipoprotein-sorting protein